jgi:transketolase
MVHTAFTVAERLASVGISVGVVDLFNISGFDADSFLSALRSYSGIVTMEEGFRGRGGLDSMVFDFLTRRRLEARVLNIGVEPAYRFELGTRAELHEQVGIGVDAVEKSITAFSESLSV